MVDIWGRKLRARYRDDIKQCRHDIELLQGSTLVASVNELKDKRNKLSSLLAQEETFWKQHAKVYWLRDGDTNTKFLHAMASARKRRNCITKLV